MTIIIHKEFIYSNQQNMMSLEDIFLFVKSILTKKVITVDLYKFDVTLYAYKFDVNIQLVSINLLLSKSATTIVIVQLKLITV